MSIEDKDNNQEVKNQVITDEDTTSKTEQVIENIDAVSLAAYFIVTRAIISNMI